ncbi:hypothetical protein T492DRAFT_1002751 [Pavlovales sp. CCMP2436]|nr:hypothetical protein T492DRAFT_1002751 [Pavlovales sp. CCMP2436]|mmetsp:Transcript_45086/g.111776  ORF Transcript_45086/g.111776 Transcript_45086/m.111776 type:complete len:206 (+) Transcript_45086:102-719(+)
MPKDGNIAKKAIEDEKKALIEAKKTADAEAADWEDGSKKPNAKKAAEAAKKEEKANKKAEADEQLEEELAPKAGKVTGNKANKTYSGLKLTQAQVAENLAGDAAAAAKAEAKAKGGVVNDYMGRLEENTNSLDAINASSLDDAIIALEASNDTRVDKIKLRAAYAAYEEAEMPGLKDEKPGLKMSQYKEMAWKNWGKSPQNPLRQ